MVSEAMEEYLRPRPRSFLVPDFNFKFKLPRRRAATDVEWRRQSSSFSTSDGSSVSRSEPSLKDQGSQMTEKEEDDFFDMLTKFQSSRIDDQRIEIPASLLKHQQLQMEIGQANEDKKDIEPIDQVLDLGAPYPIVVLPVDGEYWLEGNYHILSRDLNDRPLFPAIDMSRCTLAEDTSVYNYRRNFVGKEHFNFAGIDTKHGPMLLSVLLDLSVDDDVPDQYRAILRLKDRSYDSLIPTKIFSTDMPGPRDFIKHILQDDDLEVDRFHPVSLLRGSDEITKFDEHTTTNCYKFGVVLQKFGQTTEEDFLQNQHETPAFREFLDFLGTRVDLQDFPNYRGGLDVKHGQTGEHSYFTNYKNKEVMFHVSTMLPYSQTDSQQLKRKRHIGNDVVSIIFQEENTPFCPSTFRSHFLHVFIIVQVEDACTENTRYKVSITAKEGVPKFSPTLPTPSIFKKGLEFRNFLLTKLLNAEIAAVKCKSFSMLAERTRSMLLQGLVSEFITKNEKLLDDETLTSPINMTSKGSSGSARIISSFRSALHGKKECSESSSNLVALNQNGHSLSLNDMSSISSTESNNNGESKKTSSKEKKNRKKDKRLTPESTSPRSHSPTNGSIKSCSDVSPTLHHPSHYKEKHKSRFYTNQLFETDFSLQQEKQHSLFQTQSLPRNVMATGRLSPSSPKTRRPVSHVVMSNGDDGDNDNQKLNLLASQLEIDKLKAEVNKLKMDKMDLVRQNVTYQQEIKKLNERTIIQAVDSYTHQLKSLQQQSKKYHYGATPTTCTEFV